MEESEIEGSGGEQERWVVNKKEVEDTKKDRGVVNTRGKWRRAGEIEGL